MPVDYIINDDVSQYPHTIEIAKRLGKLDEVITWSKQELEGEWRWRLDETGGADGDTGKEHPHHDGLPAGHFAEQRGAAG